MTPARAGTIRVVRLHRLQRISRRQLAQLRTQLRRGVRATRLAARRSMARLPGRNATELATAVRADRLDEVERLAAAGVDLDATVGGGRTALHLATRLGRAEIAAALLAHGAAFDRRDARGRAPLELDHTDVDTLHAVRQHYQRHRAPARPDPAASDAVVARRAGDLEARGITRLDPLDTDLLAELRTDFDAIIDEIESMTASGEAAYRHYDQEAYYWEDDKAYATNNAFKHSAALARLSCSRPIVDIARAYLGDPFHIQRAMAMRYLPEDASSHREMFHFHHDLVDKRLKIMVLLTDVEAGDQTMSYVIGSQALFHPYEMFHSNPCSLEYCKHRLGPLEIVETVGPAGTVYLFDSNGAHCGNRRRTGKTRDAYFVELSTARTPHFGGDVPPDVLSDGRLDDPRPLQFLLHAPKRWEHLSTRGTSPSWIMDLPDPARWVWETPASS